MHTLFRLPLTPEKHYGIFKCTLSHSDWTIGMLTSETQGCEFHSCCDIEHAKISSKFSFLPFQLKMLSVWVVIIWHFEHHLTLIKSPVQLPTIGSPLYTIVAQHTIDMACSVSVGINQSPYTCIACEWQDRHWSLNHMDSTAPKETTLFFATGYRPTQFLKKSHVE